MSAYRDEDPRIHDIKTRIRVVPNFPKPGFFCFFFSWLLRNIDLAEIPLWSRILELNSRIGCCNWVLHTKFLLDSKFCSFLKSSPSCLSSSFHFHYERHRMFMLFCCFGKTRLSFHDSRLYVLFHIYIYYSTGGEKQRIYGYASFLVISLSLMVYYGRYYVSRYHHPITES
jgi:hypothetical protein